MFRIGAHVSTQGGLTKAFENALSIGANTIQIFGASPVRWSAPLPSKEVSKQFKEMSKEYDISPVFLHAPYLINLASQNGDMPKISQALLQRHLEIANEMGAFGVIFHIGSRGSRSEKEAEKIVVDKLSEILNKIEFGNLLIENSAGAGNLVGDSLEEISSIINGVKSSRLGFCFDTAHAFGSGLIKEYSSKEVDTLTKNIDKYIGLDKLWAIHLNDSKVPAGSNKDRHDNIGKGLITRDGFRVFLKNKIFQKIPLILEVPGFDGNGPDKKNIDIVKKLMSE